jgi:hypothetical protein
LLETGADKPAVAGLARGVGPFGWRRRKYVVDARYQLRTGILVGLVAIVLLVLLNASLILPYRSTSGSASPAAFAQSSHPASDRSSLAFLLLGSAVFLGGVVVIGLTESHRTAGASFAIRRVVDALREGQSQARVRLRKGDHLQDLARSINQLAETIETERLRRG